jgi:hypothetical protein
VHAHRVERLAQLAQSHRRFGAAARHPFNAVDVVVAQRPVYFEFKLAHAVVALAQVQLDAIIAIVGRTELRANRNAHAILQLDVLAIEDEFVDATVRKTFDRNGTIVKLVKLF